MTVESKSTVIEDGEIEIRLTDIIAFLKRSSQAILIGAVAGTVLGALYAFSKPNEFTVQVTVMPEIQGKGASSLGNIGSLAGLAGIDVSGLSAGTDAIRPELYPNVLQSVPFALHLLAQPVESQESGKRETLNSYLTAKLGHRLSGWLASLSNDETIKPVSSLNGLLQVTKKQEVLVSEIQNRVATNYDKKTGVIAISATMPDPVIAAVVSRLSLDYLTKYITNYRTEKSRREVNFLNKQVLTVQRRYQSSEEALSSYRDRNRSLFLNTAKIEEQRIQAEFLLAQDLYNTLSKQAEMAKIKIQENTPIFNVLEPAKVPIKKSGPNRGVILVVGLFLGVVISVVSKIFFLLLYKR